MGEEREDTQRLKRIAADSYDYDNDSRWPDYWSNVLIPPHMASRNDVVSHFKRKFYQRYVDSDLMVEPMSVGASSSQPARSSATSSTTPPTNNQPRARSSVLYCTPAQVLLYVLDFSAASTNRTSGTTSSTAGAAPLRWDRQTIMFSVNAWVFVVGFLATIPLVPKHLSHRAYRLSFLGTTCSSLYSLYSQYGLLKLMYHVPVTAPYHQSVWAQIGRTVNPVIQRHVPFLKAPVTAIQRWWLSRHPEVLWAQRSDKVYLTVALPDAKDVSVKCEPQGWFSFSASGVQDESYSFSLELYGSIEPEKGEKGWWKRLLKSEEKPAPYLKVDWNKWCDEDEESTSELVSDDDSRFVGQDEGSSDDDGMLYLPDLEKARG
ncbi:uncharacterized protein HKW66_Vig0148540 [Vigna angularis]|uniref:Co-chaperone protein p23 n=1 Tax=Phaseolus angularis TaxID=3914 RepID=A0A8T0JUM7_PHAAN|nr:uncharacterized protein HKW66_Vig0148540 [Vigna angularis]